MPDKKPAKKPDAKSQVEKFRELARQIGAADSEEPLNEAIRKVGGVRGETRNEDYVPLLPVLHFDTGEWEIIHL